MIRGDASTPEPVEENGVGRLTGAEALDFTRQVAGLARASLPLPSGLRALAEETKAGRLRRMLREAAVIPATGSRPPSCVTRVRD